MTEGGLGLAIPAHAVRSAASRSAHSVTSENRPSRAGVVRRIARSDHCRCVSPPRWRRTSDSVTSTRHLWTNQPRIATGSATGSVLKNACGGFSPSPAHQRPTDRQLTTEAVPEHRARVEVEAALRFAVATPLRCPLPHGRRIGQPLVQRGQPRPFTHVAPWPARCVPVPARTARHRGAGG